MHSRHLQVAVVLFAAFLAGCATPVSTNIKPSAAHVAKYNDLAALDVVATLEKNVNDAKNANMPFLAPNYYREAAQVLSECQSALGNKPKEVLVNNAAKGEAILEKGRSVMDIVKYRFAKELEFKAQLDEHNAPKLLPREYENVIGDLSKLIDTVEREQQVNIDKDKEVLLKSMLDLVIKAVQEGALRESETLNIDSKKKNADKQAPRDLCRGIARLPGVENPDRRGASRQSAGATFECGSTVCRAACATSQRPGDPAADTTQNQCGQRRHERQSDGRWRDEQQRRSASWRAG